MSAVNFLLESPSYRESTTEAVKERRAKLLANFVDEDYQYTEPKTEVAEKLQVGVHSLDMDLGTMKRTRRFLTDPASRPELLKKLPVQKTDASLWGIRFLVRDSQSGITEWGEYHWAPNQEEKELIEALTKPTPHKNGKREPKKKSSRKASRTKRVEPQPLPETMEIEDLASKLRDFSGIEAITQAAATALSALHNRILHFDTEAKAREEELHLRIQALEHDNASLKKQLEELALERDMLAEENEKNFAILAQLRSVLPGELLDRAPDPEAIKPEEGSPVPQDSDRFSLLPKKCGDWANGARIEYDRNFKRFFKEADSRKAGAVLKALELLTEEGSDYPGLDTHPYIPQLRRLSGLNVKLKASRIGRVLRLIWSYEARTLRIHEFGHHTTYYRNES